MGPPALKYQPEVPVAMSPAGTDGPITRTESLGPNALVTVGDDTVGEAAASGGPEANRDKLASTPAIAVALTTRRSCTEVSFPWKNSTRTRVAPSV
jgi:hypothetical protein